MKLDHSVAHVEQLDEKLKSRTLIVCVVPLLVGNIRQFSCFMCAFSRSQHAQATPASIPTPLCLALNWALKVRFIGSLPLIE